MKLQINRDLLSEAVSFAVKLLPQRTTLPILSGVLLTAHEDTLTVSSFDYEVSAQTQITASVTNPGVVLVSGKLLADIASKLPQSEVSLELVDGKLQVKSGSANFGLFTMPVEEYPTLPTISDWTGQVPAQDFAEAVAQVSIAASRDDVTPVITGVQIEAKKESLNFVATDRYRVAVRSIGWKNESDDEVSALISARTISEVAKTFSHQGTVNIAVSTTDDREIVAFEANNRTVTSLMIKGNFPPVHKLFPETVENFAVLKTADLIDATRRVSLVLDRESPLRFTFNLDGLTLEAIGSEQAQASETIEAFLTGDETIISMKPQFLIDALSSVHTELTKLAFTKTDNPNKPGPVLISGHTSKDQSSENTYRYLLQPNLLLR